MMASTVLVCCTKNKSTLSLYPDVSIESAVITHIPEIPDVMKQLLTPEFVDLLGKSRREIRPRYRVETSERDAAFWYSGLGWLEDGTEGNVFISYSIPGMSYDGLCTYISGEIDRITPFPKDTTFSDFERILGLTNKGVDIEGFVYFEKDWEIYADRDIENNEIINRITVRSVSKP